MSFEVMGGENWKNSYDIVICLKNEGGVLRSEFNGMNFLCGGGVVLFYEEKGLEEDIGDVFGFFVDVYILP